MKKKAISLILAALMGITSLSGCSTLKGDDKGATINMYLTTEVHNFDPHCSIVDDAQLKVLSLIYEGLTTMGENGKWQKALMKDYSVESNKDDDFSIIVNLKETRWSDGRTVQAADFVYAWKRLLDAELPNEAASLLYEIKNARAIKQGDKSIDDLGVSAPDIYVLKIEFERKIDLDVFFANCSSIALVPLREDVITRYGETVWATKPSTIVTNGPFQPREMTETTLRLERSAYYFRDPEKKQALDKYVIPFRLLVDFSKGDASKQLEAFNDGTLDYNGEIPLNQRAALADQVKLTDMMATHTYVFNTKNPLFAKAEVRRALSMALDRQAIADIVVYADPATGYIPTKVFDTAKGTSFREVGGDLLNTTADVAGAKNLLKSAGVTSGSFEITVRKGNAVDLAVANYVVGVWKGLGFDVSIKELGRDSVTVDEDSYPCDEFLEAYDSSDFDVIAIDMNMLSPYAFNALSQFSAPFSGNGVDMNSDDYDMFTHVSGYSSAAYDELIQQAYNDQSTDILHQAEKKLMEDMPVCPLVFLKDAYLVSDDLKGVSSDYYGTRDFNEAKLKDYVPETAPAN